MEGEPSVLMGRTWCLQAWQADQLLLNGPRAPEKTFNHGFSESIQLCKLLLDVTVTALVPTTVAVRRFCRSGGCCCCCVLKYCCRFCFCCCCCCDRCCDCGCWTWCPKLNKRWIMVSNNYFALNCPKRKSSLHTIQSFNGGIVELCYFWSVSSTIVSLLSTHFNQGARFKMFGRLATLITPDLPNSIPWQATRGDRERRCTVQISIWGKVLSMSLAKGNQTLEY